MKAVKAAALLLAAICLPVFSQAGAQEYPSRPIRMIVPWPPGGITDVIARGLAASLSESLKQQVVLDNRPGAAGTLGVAIVAKAPPDGYTLMMTDVPSHAISASLYTTLSYDALKDIEPISLPSRSALVLVINPKLGLNTVARLIDYAKAHPGQLAFASSGNGAITHLTAERFKRDTGTSLLHVTYKGGVPATTAIVSGEVALGFVCSSAALPHVKGGRLTALGVTLLRRSPQFPDVPTVAESIPGFEMGCNAGFFATGGTPRAIVERLHTEAMKAVEQPKMQELLATNLAEPAPYTQAQFKEHVAKEVRDWGEVVRAAGLKVE
jgi:tripartite-type tricarboxylate transporter receptor subunit TctC